MSFLYPLSKVAVGYNNAGSMVAWESITPSGDVPFFAPVIFGGFSQGDRMVRADGSIYFRGFPNSKIKWGAITEKQVYYLINTICVGNYWGPITIEFRKEDPSNYVTANAMLVLPDLAQSNRQGRAYKDYTAQLTRIVFL